jgi:predicted protein tyrosine phosphatase
MTTFNRLHNMKNPNQGKAKKVLCVCSAGLLRSPTLAWILSNEPFNYNTRAVGTSNDYALIVLDEVNLQWADAVVFVDKENHSIARYEFSELIDNMECHVLKIPDVYQFRHPKLIEAATEQLKEAFKM